MNGQERRAAKARSRHAKLDPHVAVHEAGHAVGHFLTAADLGYTPTNRFPISMWVSVDCLNKALTDACDW
jgi:hypothetical protein